MVHSKIGTYISPWVRVILELNYMNQSTPNNAPMELPNGLSP